MMVLLISHHHDEVINACFGVEDGSKAGREGGGGDEGLGGRSVVRRRRAEDGLEKFEIVSSGGVESSAAVRYEALAVIQTQFSHPTHPLKTLTSSTFCGFPVSPGFIVLSFPLPSIRQGVKSRLTRSGFG
jgi:hypothetical protein